MLLNLAAVANSDNPAVLWGFLRRYAPSATPENHPRLDRLVDYAVAYFRDFVAPKKRYRAADEVERDALEAVSAKLAALPRGRDARRRSSTRSTTSRGRSRATRTSSAKGATPERPGVSNEFFNMIYAVLLGEERGPRFGSFIALYGIEETRALIAKALGAAKVARRAKLTSPARRDRLSDTSQLASETSGLGVAAEGRGGHSIALGHAGVEHAFRSTCGARSCPAPA